MITNVTYFGMIAEKIGVGSEQIPITEQPTPLDLKVFFESKYPVLKKLTYQVAVNLEIESHLDTNQSQVEIALLPPFAGG
jgi:molybdopterin synthase sulfur carrier subunit